MEPHTEEKKAVAVDWVVVTARGTVFPLPAHPDAPARPEEREGSEIARAPAPAPGPTTDGPSAGFHAEGPEADLTLEPGELEPLFQPEAPRDGRLHGEVQEELDEMNARRSPAACDKVDKSVGVGLDLDCEPLEHGESPWSKPVKPLTVLFC